MRNLTLIAVLAALALGVTSATAQAGKKPPKKKPAKPPVSKTQGGGTDQLAGDNCEIGKTYKLGKDNAVLVKVIGVEYSATRTKWGSGYWTPEPGSKFMIVKYDIQNIKKEEMRVEANIDWTAVSAKDESFQGNAMQLLSDGTRIFQSLKPAQHLQVFTIIKVDGKGEIPKLMMVNHEDGPPVGRYSLKGKVKAIEAPYADPADASGATPLEIVKGVVGKTYQVGEHDISIDEVKTSTDVLEALDSEAIEEGHEYVLVTIKEGNFNCDGNKITGAQMDVELKDADGEAYTPYNTTVRMSSTKSVTPDIEFGQTATYRKVFLVPKGTKLASVRVAQGGYRPLVVELSK